MSNYESTPKVTRRTRPVKRVVAILLGLAILLGAAGFAAEVAGHSAKSSYQADIDINWGK